MDLFEALQNMKDTMEGAKPPKKLKYSKKEIEDLESQEPWTISETVEHLQKTVSKRWESEEFILLNNPAILISNVTQAVSKSGNEMLVIEFLDTLANVKAVKYQTLYNVGKLLKAWGIEEVPEKVDDIIDIILGSTVRISSLSRWGNTHIVDYFTVVKDEPGENSSIPDFLPY